MPTDKTLLVKIREVLTREDTVLFIGAGISRWSGLPSWRELIEELAKFVEEQGQSAELIRKEAKANDLLQAASYGLDLLTPAQFSEFIRGACRINSAQPHEIHKRIVSLRPKCFITTNYDQLLEQSLSEWRSNEHFDVVSNKQLTEAATIIQARATNFVFKPHGDVNDSDSIIFTRDQYRVLHGDKKYILDALNTLLVSRPVIYIGFGLRDPDFIFVKDTLANTYKGGARDHYAIMADVSDQERAYWRKHYGVHLLSYSTLKRDEMGGRDHRLLMSLLDELLEGVTEEPVVSKVEPVVAQVGDLLPNQVLALARHAAGLISTLSQKADEEMPLRVTCGDEGRLRSIWSKADLHYKYDDAPVEGFLEQFKTNALLIGNPGAGKTYAFKSACSRLAQDLHKTCLFDSARVSTAIVPIYLDFKLYTGNLWDMAEQMIPRELSLEHLAASGSIRFFLDSFNEMPRQLFDSRSYEKDLNDFFNKARSCPVIIGSRTEEGLQNFKLPKFRLDEIDETYVTQRLSKSNVNLGGVFGQEVVDLLRKPLFFRLFLEGKIKLDGRVHPRQVYRSLFDKLDNEFKEKYGESISFEEIIAPIAYSAVDQGQEALFYSELQTQLKRHLSRAGLRIDAEALINWLISRDLLVPASGSRLTFFHQSVTEYLAAKELAKLYKAAPAILERQLKHTRWDQALFLTLGFLEANEAQIFIEQVLETDIVLSIRASKYVEFDREALIARVLQTILNGNFVFEQRIEIHNALIRLPVSDAHSDILYSLMMQRDVVGGIAAKLLTQLHGKEMTDILLAEIIRNPVDGFYSSSLSKEVSPFVTVAHLEDILVALGNMHFSNYEGARNLIYSVGEAFSKLNIDDVLDLFCSWQYLNDIQMDVFCDILGRDKTRQGFEMLVDLVKAGEISAVYSLYSKLCFPGSEEQIAPNLFDTSLIAALIRALPFFNQGTAVLQSIKRICALRPDLFEAVEAEASKTTGITKFALLHCRDDDDAFWLQVQPKNLSNKEAAQLFKLRPTTDINWQGKEATLINLLKRRDVELANQVILSVSYERKDRLQIPVEPVMWWIEWMQEVAARKSGYCDFCGSLGSFLVFKIQSSAQSLFVEEFNKKDCPHREIFAKYILRNMETNLTTDMLSEDALSFLIGELSHPGHNDLLGAIATESFVEQRLLPLLSSSEQPLNSNLRAVLQRAGGRHRRRYITNAS